MLSLTRRILYYSERQERIDQFNQTTEIDVCLLTTKACAYGITLTGADRVIIYDPSWNPAEDRQVLLLRRHSSVAVMANEQAFAHTLASLSCVLRCFVVARSTTRRWTEPIASVKQRM